jgi:amidase
MATLKPTNGLVPVTGVIDDEGPIGALSDPRTQLGPIARTVEDLTLLLSVLAGPDARDAGVAPVPPGDPTTVRVETLRVAVHTADPLGTPTPETAATVAAAAQALASAGARVEEATPARRRPRPHPRGLALLRPRHDQPGPLPAPPPLGPVPGPAAGVDDRLGRHPHPGLRLPAPPHGATESPDLQHAVRRTTPWSLTGWPGTVVRRGTSPEGLPIGVQLVAAPRQDHLTLAVARHLESTLGGWQPPPDTLGTPGAPHHPAGAPDPDPPVPGPPVGERSPTR